MFITGITQKIECWVSETDTAYRLAAGYYQDVIQKEIVLANITKDDHILCIGGGVCPFSAILFHQKTKAKVTVIDNNIDCVNKSRKVIKRLGLDEFIQIICQDGSCETLSIADYTVIHFALQVNPMENVFAYIEKNATPGTRLLVRRPKARLGRLYSCLLKDLYICPLTIHSKTCNIGSTVLYIKQEDNNEEEMDIGYDTITISDTYPTAV